MKKDNMRQDIRTLERAMYFASRAYEDVSASILLDLLDSTESRDIRVLIYTTIDALGIGAQFKRARAERKEAAEYCAKLSEEVQS